MIPYRIAPSFRTLAPGGNPETVHRHWDRVAVDVLASLLIPLALPFGYFATPTVPAPFVLVALSLDFLASWDASGESGVPRRASTPLFTLGGELTMEVTVLSPWTEVSLLRELADPLEPCFPLCTSSVQCSGPKLAHFGQGAAWLQRRHFLQFACGEAARTNEEQDFPLCPGHRAGFLGDSSWSAILKCTIVQS
jgi:hypothetical protein